MTEYKIMDGFLFKQMIINGAFNLKNNHQKINNLNVFPVPDGDTGTNMYLTMMEGVEKLQSNDESSIIKVTQILSDALLMGSKGNSGVILSQFFSGIHEYINNLQKNSVDVKEFIESWISGYQKAYAAVIEPVEGTILTVLRESIELTVKQKDKINTIKEVIQTIIRNAKISLRKTPDLLPILKESKVVDSGGAGFIFIIEGMLLYLNNIKLKDEDINELYLKANHRNHNINENIELKYTFCTEFIIKLNKNNQFGIDEYKKTMNSYGDSLILFTDDDLLKIHIHTNFPDNVLKQLLLCGTLVKSKIDNMKKQNKEFIWNNQTKNNKYFLVTFVDDLSEDIEKTFKELHSDIVINLQTKNYSSEDLNLIFNKINSEIIVVFPNGPEIISVIENLSKLEPSLNIKIMPTKNIVESYNALLVFQHDLSLEENLNNIQMNMKKIKISKIINLKYLSKIQTETVDLDGFSSCFQEKIIENHKDLVVLAKNLLTKMIDKTNSFLTIFYDKQTIFEKNLEKIESFLEKKFPELEIEKIESDNNVYPYIFSLE
ncbi:MAG: DAK2 domain-containing protein [Phytoplasma sp.]|uniref:DAK2 domain-containing protein n=1 Tax=Phytoplasma sp. TaxID=2155 RepID=UPI002B40CBFF|nr:DAK2 domain-containing protein [Phytoplasma sp.]WRH06944.1 MAG: DAK2 domain-containing protein [Phytoplasma sp.]